METTITLKGGSPPRRASEFGHPAEHLYDRAVTKMLYFVYTQVAVMTMCCHTPRREWATPTPTKDFQDFLLESKIIFAHCGVASGRRELVKVPVLSQQCCANPQQPEVFPTQLKDVTKH